MKLQILFTFIILTVSTETYAGRYRAGTDRCVNLWDEGCINGQLPGSGGDDDYLNGGFNPGKRCVNLWDEGCVNGQLNGAGGDDDYLNGGFNPGKRALEAWLIKMHKSKQHN